MRKNSK